MNSHPGSDPKSLLGSYLRFLRSPNLNELPQNIPPSKKLAQILCLYGPEVVFALLILPIIEPKSAQEAELVRDIVSTSAIELFLSAVVLAPLLEETIFRLPLYPSALNILLPCSLVTLGISLFLGPSGASQLWLLLLIFSAFIIKEYSNGQSLQQFYSRHGRLIFYSSTLLFGAIHITNYEPEAWHLLPFLVLSQTIGGASLGFIRIRYGFWWAIFTHGLYNGFLLLPICLLKIFGSEQLQIHELAEGSDETLTQLDHLLSAFMDVYFGGALIICLIITWQLFREWWKLDRLS